MGFYSSCQHMDDMAIQEAVIIIDLNSINLKTTNDTHKEHDTFQKHVEFMYCIDAEYFYTGQDVHTFIILLKTAISKKGGM